MGTRTSYIAPHSVCRINICVPPEVLRVIDGRVKSQGRSRFMALAAMLVLTDGDPARVVLEAELLELMK